MYISDILILPTIYSGVLAATGKPLSDGPLKNRLISEFPTWKYRLYYASESSQTRLHLTRCYYVALSIVSLGLLPLLSAVFREAFSLAWRGRTIVVLRPSELPVDNTRLKESYSLDELSGILIHRREDALRAALSSGVGPNFQIDRGMTLLKMAVLSDWPEGMRLLIDAGAVLDTTLVEALLGGSAQSVELLLQAGADAGLESLTGIITREPVLITDSVSKLKLLLRYGASIGKVSPAFAARSFEGKPFEQFCREHMRAGGFIRRGAALSWYLHVRAEADKLDRAKK